MYIAKQYPTKTKKLSKIPAFNVSMDILTKPVKTFASKNSNKPLSLISFNIESVESLTSTASTKE